MKKTTLIFLSFITLNAVSAQTKRPINPSDFLRYVDITDPQVSPDGKWCTYTVTTVDTLKDENINVVLQDNENCFDDGSLSVYCGKKQIRYANVEAEEGHLREQVFLIEIVEKNIK